MVRPAHLLAMSANNEAYTESCVMKSAYWRCLLRCNAGGTHQVELLTQVLPRQYPPSSQILLAQQVQPRTPYLCGSAKASVPSALETQRRRWRVSTQGGVQQGGDDEREAHPTSVVTPIVAPPPLFVCLPRAVRLSVRILKSSAGEPEKQLRPGC